MGETIKKIIIIISSIIVILVIALFIFITIGKSGVTGKYNLVSGDEGCFTKFTFTDGPPNTRVVSFSEVTGNSEKMLMGYIKTKKDIMHIEVTNFDNIEPFDLTYEHNNDQLTVTYQWENKDYTCTYEQDN